MITDEDKTAIGEAVAEKLNERRYVDEDTHALHHKHMQRMIDKEKAKQEFWEGVKNRLVEQGVIRAFWLLVTLSTAGAVAWATGFFHTGGPGPHG